LVTPLVTPDLYAVCSGAEPPLIKLLRIY